ncbi:MAG: peptidylprolyl isomerase [Proteobacteria bacterium]|nr:peptidylprolyl isomerase [Pseudomonadota bacterium]
MGLTVNGIAVDEAAIDAEVQYHPAADLTAARAAAARALVVRELLLQQTARLGIDEPDPGEPGETREDGLIRALFARELRLPEADDATCRRYYARNRKRFSSPDLYEGAHILFAAAPDDDAARADARTKAEAVLARLATEPRAFDALARALSACPSGKDGGRLGQVARGDTAPELETFLFALEPGQLCPLPVATRYGIHVIRLDRKVEGRELPYEQAADRIAAYLTEQAWRRAARQYVTLLVGQADIGGVAPETLGLLGTTSPLVQ